MNRRLKCRIFIGNQFSLLPEDISTVAMKRLYQLPCHVLRERCKPGRRRVALIDAPCLIQQNVIDSFMFHATRLGG